MNRISEIRSRKIFSAWDLFFYAALALLTVLLLLAVFLPKKGEEFAGIEILIGGETAYVYRFGEGGNVQKGYESAVREETEDGRVTVTVLTEQGFNAIVIDETARSVFMRDSDCSFRRDCTRMKQISSASGAIVCLPHDLKVLPVSRQERLSPAIG